MIYLKGVFIGLCTVLLGMPIALIVWSIVRFKPAASTISFSPLGLTNHLAHSFGIWVLMLALFTAGFVPFVFLKRR